MNTKEIAKIREQKKKRVFTNEQIKRARLNGISYSRLWERVKNVNGMWSERLILQFCQNHK